MKEVDINKLTKNQLAIILKLQETGGTNYKELEPLVETNHKNRSWAVFSCLCDLIQAGVIKMDYKPKGSIYRITPYAKRMLHIG